jgi:hypothetical protein
VVDLERESQQAAEGILDALFAPLRADGTGSDRLTYAEPPEG